MEFGESQLEDLLCTRARHSFISRLYLHVHKKKAQSHQRPGELVCEKQLAGGPAFVRLSYESAGAGLGSGCVVTQSGQVTDTEAWGSVAQQDTPRGPLVLQPSFGWIHVIGSPASRNHVPLTTCAGTVNTAGTWGFYNGPATCLP